MERKEIENILKDYHWMINSIKLLRASMKEAGERLTAQYGEEAGMPKGKGGRQSDPVFQEVKRREKRWGVVHKYEKKVQLIQQRIHLVTGQRESEILHWLLEGKSIKWIALHMSLSERHVFRLKDKIVDEMADMSGMSGMSEKAEKMTKEKCSV